MVSLSVGLTDVGMVAWLVASMVDMRVSRASS